MRGVSGETHGLAKFLEALDAHIEMRNPHLLVVWLPPQAFEDDPDFLLHPKRLSATRAAVT